MSYQSPAFKRPPRLQTDSGTTRRVGFELELSGLTLDEAARALQSALGGEMEEVSAAQRLLKVEALGEFRIELDWDFLKRKATEQTDQEEADSWLSPISEAAALIVPVEVVCPPIAITDLEILGTMVRSLRQNGALGTDESLLSAYGVHINTEVPDLRPTTLWSYLKAFAVAQWWLVDAHEVDIARRISPYIDPYPEAYIKKLISRKSIRLDEIFDDYLQYNETRNRALDLLPLLSEIDEERVKQAVNDPRIKARPAFHYRLPNCHIERANWTLADSWNLWWVVEELAHRSEELDELTDAFKEADRPVIGVSRADWVAYFDQWLKNHAMP